MNRPQRAALIENKKWQAVSSAGKARRKLRQTEPQPPQRGREARRIHAGGKGICSQKEKGERRRSKAVQKHCINMSDWRGRKLFVSLGSLLGISEARSPLFTCMHPCTLHASFYAQLCWQPNSYLILYPLPRNQSFSYWQGCHTEQLSACHWNEINLAEVEIDMVFNLKFPCEVKPFAKQSRGTTHPVLSSLTPAFARTRARVTERANDLFMITTPERSVITAALQGQSQKLAHSHPLILW